MDLSNFKIIKNRHPETTKCAYCDAQIYCNGRYNFICQCKPNQHYINIKKNRKEKLNEIIKCKK
jgi:hypothetical protein